VVVLDEAAGAGMGIYRRGKMWWGRAQRSGREHRLSLKTTSKAVAERRYRQWRDDLEAIAWGEKPRRRFDDAAERFIREHLPTLKITSAKRYGVSLTWLADQFEGKYLDQIGAAELAEFERNRRTAGASPPTVRRDLACLSSIFGSCIEWEWCEANPVPAYMKRRKKRGLREAPARTRYLSHEEETSLLLHSTPAVQSATAFAIDTGLRREEQFGLTWDKIDLQVGEITLDGNTKSGKQRRVPLLPRAAQILAQLPRHVRSKYVFCHANGDRYVNMEKGLKAARRRAGLRALRWHDLRRTCGCRLLQDYGMSMEAVKEWLGHSSVVVTEKAYAFLEIEHLHRAVQKSAQAQRIA
jgi:integrase/recombinase XerD